MTDVTALLAPVKARAEKATEGPWEANPTRATEWMPYYEVRSLGKGSVTPAAVDWEGFGHGANEADAAFIAQARTDVPRLVAALEAVAGLHKPLDVFQYDDTNGVFKLDEDGEQIPAGSFCQGCSEPDVIQSIEDCEYDTSGGYGEVSWPCPTITAVVAALGGGE